MRDKNAWNGKEAFLALLILFYRPSLLKITSQLRFCPGLSNNMVSNLIKPNLFYLGLGQFFIIIIISFLMGGLDTNLVLYFEAYNK